MIYSRLIDWQTDSTVWGLTNLLNPHWVIHWPSEKLYDWPHCVITDQHTELFMAGLEIATDTVANATNIFSLATKNSGLVAKVATRFLYILDLN